MFVLSLAFLVGFIMVIDPGSNDQYLHMGQVLMFIGWLGFLIDYVISLLLAPNRHHYVRHHLVAAVAIIVPPLHILLMGKVLKTMTSGAKRKFGSRVRMYALYLTTLTMVLAALAVSFFERQDPASNIKSFGEALWWTSETVSTVGYGDYYPITFMGRVVAIVLFVNGIALVSAVTATVAARVLDFDDETGQESDVNLAELARRLSVIESKMDQLIDLRQPQQSTSTTAAVGDSDSDPS